MHKTAIYPGTFDPLTNGHMDIIRRASMIFDTLIVAVAKSATKEPMFPLSEREEMLRLATRECPSVRVESFDTLLADFAQERGACILVRGLRAVSDFEYELQMGYANASLNPALETIYLMPSLQNAFISSSVIRSILLHKGKISHLVPPVVCEYIQKSHSCM
ncbi:pantetheine-phosphate adenylyltransferase [Wolinella succinogenes]|uniref:pantetheine-phosphate adenylyltransferase n=1 Tax=Wolinella succinogenes TaxID=844 RepID=UPI002FC6F6FC